MKALTEGIFNGPGRHASLRAELKRRAAVVGPEALHKKLAEVDPVAAAKISNRDTRRIIRALEVLHETKQPISSLQTQFGQRRPQYERHILALRHEREYLRKRIADRIERMFAKGLIEEIKAMGEKPLGKTAAQSIGYLEVTVENVDGKPVVKHSPIRRFPGGIIETGDEFLDAAIAK